MGKGLRYQLGWWKLGVRLGAMEAQGSSIVISCERASNPLMLEISARLRSDCTPCMPLAMSCLNNSCICETVALVVACRLNLASFVTTWMEPEAEKLIMDSLNVNFVDAGTIFLLACIRMLCASCG